MNILIIIPLLLSLLAAFSVYLFKDSQRKVKNIVIATLVSLTLIACIVNACLSNLSLDIISNYYIIKIIFLQ